MIPIIIGILIYAVIGSFSAGIVFFMLFNKGECETLGEMDYGPIWMGFLWPICIPFIAGMYIMSRIAKHKSSNKRGDKENESSEC